MATANIFPPALSSQIPATICLNNEVQQFKRDSLWPGSSSIMPEWLAYFRYFQWTIESVIWPNAATETSMFTVQQYRDLALVIKCMREYDNESRLQIATRLRGHFSQSSQDCILRSMDLAVRLWLTVHVRSNDVPIGPLVSNVTIARWESKQSLRSLIKTNFPKSRNVHMSASLRNNVIDPSFNVMNLRRISRVKVQWTHSLKDHLRFDHSTKTISIYPHKICLLNHLEHCKIYPKDLLVETLATLDLLFPYGDQSTELWLRKQGHSFHRTSSSYMRARASDFSTFSYWRPNLLELHYVYQQPPTTIPQIWYDRRNPMQWYTFFLAVTIAVLTVVFGSLGVYIGFKQIALAERGIKIALAQNH